jgi:hypothetical protein
MGKLLSKCRRRGAQGAFQSASCLRRDMAQLRPAKAMFATEPTARRRDSPLVAGGSANRRLARGFAWYGLMASSLIILASLGGHIRLDVHGFGLIWLLQSIWFVVAGCLLMRSVEAEC